MIPESVFRAPAAGKVYDQAWEALLLCLLETCFRVMCPQYPPTQTNNARGARSGVPHFKLHFMAYFELYDTVVDSDLIAGVGPLLSVQNFNDTDLINRYVTFTFDVYLKGGGTMVLSTKKLSFSPEHKEKSERANKVFFKNWSRLRDNLLIGGGADLGFPITLENFEP